MAINNIYNFQYVAKLVYSMLYKLYKYTYKWKRI